MVGRWRQLGPRSVPVSAVRGAATARSPLAVSVLQRSPEIPARRRRVRPPFLADPQYVLRRWPMLQAVRALDGVLHAEIELGEHVRPAEPEHEEHLHRPSADALHLYEVLDDRVVGKSAEMGEWQRAIGHAGGEVAQISDLLTRQSRGAQHALFGGQHVLGARPLPRIDLAQPPMDRARCLARQLLEDNRPHERIVVCPTPPRLEPTRPDAIDDATEDRIDGPEMGESFSVGGRGHGGNKLPLKYRVRRT